MTGNKVKIRRQTVFMAIAGVLVIGFIVGLFLIGSQKQREAELELIQNEALAELKANEGSYDPQSIVLQDTSRTKAKELATLTGGRLRITENGDYATITLPQGKTIYDVFSKDEMKEYIPEMSADYQISIADIAPLTEVDDGELNYTVYPRPSYTVTDPGYDRQDYLDYIHVGDAWQWTRGSGITVAVIDTGIDTDHVEFAGKISEYSYNATEDKVVKDYDLSLIEDEQGHGTSVAGVIAAAMNDGNGIAGIAPEVQLLVIKAECDEYGTFYRTSDLVFGLYYAIERDAQIVNMSFGCGGMVNPFAEATQLAVDSDVICVAAAGNAGTSALTWPAADPNVIGVGALAPDSFELAEYSNYGENSDMVAPGTVYTCAVGGGYKVVDGTSFASPVTAASLALYLSVNRYTEYAYMTEVLYAACTDLGDLGEDWYYGYGALDVNALVVEEKGIITFEMLTDELENIERVYVKGHTLQNIPLDVERNYCIFDGWYYGYDCAEGDELELYSTKFTKDITLYASWVNEDDGIPYTYAILDDGSVEILSYTGKRRFITVPEKIEGRIVSSIGMGAFAGQTRLREVNLPSGLTNIGEQAFYGCTNLIGMQIPDGVSTIGGSAFADCPRLRSVSFGADSALQTIGSFAFSGSGLATFDLPQKVTSVDGSAFFGATELMKFNVSAANGSFAAWDGVLVNNARNTVVAYPAGVRGSYVLPGQITAIGAYAFGYSYLTEIDFTAVTSIGYAAFLGSRLTAVTIPDTVTYMGDSAFANCGNLRSVTVGNGLKVIPASAFSAALSLTELHLGADLQRIEPGAFYGCLSLTTLDLTSNSALVSIGGKAFSMCVSLTNVKFAADSKLVSIGGDAFSDCMSLPTVEIPAGVTQIGASAFANTYSLQTVTFLGDKLAYLGDFAFQSSGIVGTVTMPAGLRYLGIGAFADCDSLTDIYIAEKNKTYTDVDGVVYTKDLSKILAYPSGNARSAYTIPEGTVTVGSYTFYGSDRLTGIQLPETLTYIEEYGFSKVTNLWEVHIPDNVLQIGRYAFAKCWNLSQIYFNETSKLPRISFAAFAYTGITSMRIPANVSTMAQYAFMGSTRLTSVTFARNSKLDIIPAYMFVGSEQITSIYFEEGSALRSIAAHGLEGMHSLRSIDFTNTKLDNIDNFAFRFCRSLQSIQIPEGVTYIGRYAFYQCEALTDVQIPTTVEFIGRYAFLGAENANLYFAADHLPLYLQENWDHGIKGYYTGVTNVQTNDIWQYAVLSKGGYAVLDYLGSANVLDLTACDLDQDGSMDKVVNIGGYAFADTAIVAIILPDTLTTIQRYAFVHTLSLDSIEIPASVEFIGQYAFYGSAIDSLTFTGTSMLENIEQYAFASCKNLTAVSLPDSLVQMGTGAFSESMLTTVTFGSGLTEIPNRAFYHTRLTALTVPEQVEKIGYYAFADIPTLQTLAFGTATELMVMGNAFSGCSLQTVYIPANVGYLGEFCFADNRGMQTYTVAADHPYYTSINGILYNKDTSKLIAYPAGRTGSFEVPAHVETIGFGAFQSSSLTSVTFAKGINLLTIGNRAFYGAAIEQITVPASVVSIDYYAFATCENLETVVFATGTRLTGIYEGAFLNCRNLANIALPDSIVEISDFAFYGCEQLVRLPIGPNTGLKGIYDYAFAYTGIFGAFTTPETLIDIGAYAFAGLDITALTVPNTQAKDLIIGIGAFAACDSLTEVTLPFIGASFDNTEITWFGYIFGAGAYEANSTYVPATLKTVTIHKGITTLGFAAFYELANLETVNLPDTVENVYEYSFKDCPAKYELVHVEAFYAVNGNETQWVDSRHIGKGIISITIPDSVTSIGDYAFEDCSSLTSITIPDSVTSIGEFAFRECSSLTSITIPDNVTSIAWSSFSGCSSLTSVTIPDSVTSIGNYAFSGCSSLTSVTIPDSVTSIGDNAFSWCSSLTSITIPDSVMSIGWYAFSGCSSLTSITIPDSVTSIGDYAFYCCSSLTSITIPDSVTSIGDYAFRECSSLTRVNISSIEAWCNIVFGYEGNPLSYAENLYLNGELATELVIPDSVTRIEGGAFSNCTSLTSITIPDSVTSIGEFAFSRCSSLYEVINNSSLELSIGSTDYGYIAYYAYFLTDADGNTTYKSTSGEGYVDTVDGWQFSFLDGVYTLMFYLGDEDTATLPKDINGESYQVRLLAGPHHLIIPDGMTNIGDRMFSGCSSLTSITIPDSVMSIGYLAFSGCSSLTSITIPDSVTSIGYDAFSGCSSLTSVNISSIEAWCKISFSDANSNPLYYAENLYLNGELVTELIIPDSVTSIGDYAFSGCNSLTSITIPDSVTSIGDYAFSGCNSLTSITIPDSVMSIGWYAFSGCSSLTSITIPDSVMSIGWYAFSGCNSLTSITIPDSVTSIGDYAFSGCSSLTSITIPDSVTSIGDSAFSGCDSLTSIQINPNNQSYVFIDGVLYDKAITKIIFVLESVKSIVVPATVSNILSSFSGTNIEQISFETGSSITSIPSSAFYDCSSLTSITIPDSVTSIGDYAFSGCNSLTSITIPDSVTSIGDSAFAYCRSLTSITIPDSVTSIGDSAFEDCSSLTSITIPDGVTIIWDTFSGCSSLTSITLPDSVTRIEWYAFSDCSSLTSITLPNSLTSIGYGAFEDCSSLTSIVIPDSVTSIGDYAFSWCSSLTSITIPDSVTSIGNYAFSGCRSLTSVTIPDSVTSIGNYAFSGCRSLTSVTIPDSVTSIGNYAFSDCSSLTSITIPDSVTSIGDEAFDGCSSLYGVINHSSLEFSIGSTDYGYIAYHAYFITDADGNTVYKSSSEGVYGATGDGWVFSHLDGVYTLRFYLGDEDTATLPKDINGESYQIELQVAPRHLIIPDGMTSIGNSAFSWCSSLTSIVIPDSVTSIGDYAFSWCSSLTSITIPDSVTYIGSSAFSWCSSLTSVTIPDSVTSIGNYAFSGCSSLTSITIPDSVTSIGGSAFSYCSSLTSITIPDSVTSIGDYAFSGCSSLTSITIPDSVTSIGDSAFSGCDSLTSITIPDSVTYIGQNAFSETAYYNNPANWTDGALYVGNHLIAVSEDVEYLTVREGTVSTVPGIFEGCYRLKYLAIPTNLANGLSSLTNLETLVITSGTLGNGILYGQPITLQNIVIPGGANTIQSSSAFGGITGVTIYVGSTEKDCRWDENFPGWSNGNKVVYGDEWIQVTFTDANGDILSQELYSIFEVIRQPALDRYRTDGATTYRFLGWDIDGDGQADSIPATSAEDIDAVALYEVCRHPAGEHEFGESTVIAPTCISGGYTTHICSVCGYSERFDYIDRLNHNYTLTYVDATCTEVGGDRYTCEHCGDFYYENEISALGHDVSQWTVLRAAECMVDGERSGFCQRCGQQVVEVILATGHYYQLVSKTESTCTEHGEEYYQCDCGHTTKRILHKQDHSYSKIITSKEFAGWLSLQNPRILYGYENDGGYYYACQGCSTLMLASEAEKYGVGGGASVMSGLCQHSETVDTVVGTLTFRYCQSCERLVAVFYTGDHSESDHVHVYEAVVTKPTCTSGGYTTYTCECGDSYVDHRVSATGHTPGSAATCTQPQSCTVCGAELQAALGHTPGSAATCTQPQSCTVCGAELQATLGHTPGSAATCTQPQSCTVCGAELQAALGHSYESTVIPPTESKEGYTLHTCVRCGDSYSDSFVPATAMPGDMTGDDQVDSQDAIYLLYYSLFGAEQYPVNQECDYNHDDHIDSQDAIYLLYHSLFGAEQYPLETTPAVRTVHAILPKSGDDENESL